MIRSGEFNVVTLCDCDHAMVEKALSDRRQTLEKAAPKQEKDFRRLLDDREIDAVTIATPNHWHSLMTILACQAGKDVFVQKPSSHNLFEGRRMVEAMRRYSRVVQATHGPRNSGATEEAYEYAREGKLRPAREALARALEIEPDKPEAAHLLSVVEGRLAGNSVTGAST